MREDLVDACLDIGLGFGLVEPAIKDIEVSARFRLIDEQSRIEAAIAAKLSVNKSSLEKWI